MGQLHGKAKFIKAAHPFLNVSERYVNKLWEGFNDVAEGFGLNQDEMLEICRSLQPAIDVSTVAHMDQLTMDLFIAFDTDSNGLVDALEFLGTIAGMSAMTIPQKVTYIYNCYDFNESGQISIDELTLAFRSTLIGLCKLSLDVNCPSELVLEEIALHAFQQSGKTSPDDNISLLELLNFAEKSPEVSSWIDYFDCPIIDILSEDAEVDDSDLECGTPTNTISSTSIKSYGNTNIEFDFRSPVFDEKHLAPLQVWQNSVSSGMIPSAPPAVNLASPSANLKLEWIYGFNNKLRNMVKYISTSEIIYPTGSIIVIYHILEHAQRFIIHHTDMVQALAVNPLQKNIVASGEIGACPKIVIWNASSLDSHAVIRGFHKGGVQHIEWMSNGKNLLTVGGDEFHCIAIYQWIEYENTSNLTKEKTRNAINIDWTRHPELIFADRCGREPVYACISLSHTQFVTCGRRNIWFWSRESDVRYTSEHMIFYKRPGILGRKSKVQTLTSLTSVPNSPNMIIAGSTRGQLLVFEGRNCVKNIPAHLSTVNVIHPIVGGGGMFLSGGQDGKVRLWNKRLEPGAQYDIQALGGSISCIRSIAASPEGGTKLLLATSRADIFEIATSDGSNLHFGALVSGHFAYELHGLAAHPLKNEVCTVGDDRTIRIWDTMSHRQIRASMLDAPCRACAYSPDGSLLVIGQGASEVDDEISAKGNADTILNRKLKELVNISKQGAFAVLNENSLAVKFEAKDSKKYIRTIKFSADGLTLGVGSNDHCIYAYNTEDWASKGKCKAHDSTAILSQFDFSTSGEYIMSCATNKGEMIFFESHSGVEITRHSTLKDVEWQTWTAPYGWGVQGVWPKYVTNKYEVSAVCRSNEGFPVTYPTSSSKSAKLPLLAVGDNFGFIHLYRYPCPSLEARGFVYRGASSAISAICFNADNTLVMVCGKLERCLYQWRVEYEKDEGSGMIDPSSSKASNIIGANNSNVTEYEYTPTTDDELEMSLGKERSNFEEAASVGEFAINLLQQKKKLLAEYDGNEAECAPRPQKPWLGSCIPPSTPPDVKDASFLSVPDENLELEWVYGYRCHDVRNNIFVTHKKGYIVYPAANFVVIFDSKLWIQKHFKYHTAEVTALTYCIQSTTDMQSLHAVNQEEHKTHENKYCSESPMSNRDCTEIFASGQMGKYPVIHIWDLDSLHVLQSLRGFHHHGIAELRFNSSGTKLVSIGLDEERKLAIYDWRNGIVLASASASGTGKILGVSFQHERYSDVREGAPAVYNNSILVTVGVKALTFWHLQGQQLVKKNGMLGKKGLAQTFLSVVFCGKDAIVGTTSGDLYRFKGFEIAALIPAHTKGVAALYCTTTSPEHIVSGGKDGLVKLWTSELDCLAEFSDFNPSKLPIRSVFFQLDKNLITVGTRGCSIHQISSLDGSIIPFRTSDGISLNSLEGHYRKECRGLSVCPTKGRFCTTGDDAVLRVWDIRGRRQIFAKKLETVSRACGYSYDSDYIAVGLGADGTGKRHKKDGSVLIFEDRGQSVELVFETRDTKQPISVLKYSPDGHSLVAGSLDNCVYIYDVINQYSKRAVFHKHKAWITHLDISSDSQYIRSTCAGNELLFSDITTGSHIASATAVRNHQWDTCSTIYNWSNQGIWPSDTSSDTEENIEVTTCGISIPGNSGQINHAVIAAGSNYGTISLFKFPAFAKRAGHKTYFGHSGSIAQVEFSRSTNGSHCISLGRFDRCILQWRKLFGVAISTPVTSENLTNEFGNALFLNDIEDDPDIVVEGLFVPESLVTTDVDDMKPFLSALIPPSPELYWSKEQVADLGIARQYYFQLERVFGFRGYDIRGAITYSKNNNIVYSTGCLGVVYDRRSHTQIIYNYHKRPIVCLAASKDGSFIATGEICAENISNELPQIHIWEPSSASSVSVLSPIHAKAVTYMAFNSNNKLLATVGQDDYHCVAIYGTTTGLWFDGTLLATSPSTRESVYFITFIHEPSSTFQIVTGGKDHVLFWKLDPPNLIAHKGLFSPKGQKQALLCGASINDKVVTGCTSGHLYVWEQTAISKVVPAHNGAVYSLHSTKQGLVSGGRDGHVKLWSCVVSPLADFDINDVSLAAQDALVRAVCWDTAQDRVLIGTKGGDIIELSRLLKNPSLVTESHFGDTELHGLCAHPLQPSIVATAGEDRSVRIWDLVAGQVSLKTFLDGPLRCITFSQDGQWLAVGYGSGRGTKDGAFAILQSTTLETLHTGRDSKQSILSIQFSPDLTLLAMGSSDHCVYLYSPLDNFSLRFKFTKAIGRILHMDFSIDSRSLRINSDRFELLYVSTIDGKEITSASSMKDMLWFTHTCVFTWATLGMWDLSNPENYFHSVTKAKNFDLLVAGTNVGEVRVYNYPCLSKHSEEHVLKGHSRNISNVAFTCDDSHLVSIGASDKNLLIWKVCKR